MVFGGKKTFHQPVMQREYAFLAVAGDFAELKLGARWASDAGRGT